MLVEKIKITESLRDYIERLHYESVRYKDLLNIVSKDSCHMTDDEWNSSLEYYEELYQEAELSLQFALEELYNIYKNEIADNLWHINFKSCEIVIGSTYSEYPAIKEETYNDQLRRLYPIDSYESLSINDSSAKDITLQVTDACNMACTYCYQHNKGKHSMSFDTAKAFIDMILDADERSNSYITSTKCDGAVISFIGGEPWLEIDLISKVSDYFIGELFRRKHPWAIKFIFNVCSNGILHFDPKVQSYIKKHKVHFGYNISIDGNKELHDSCRIDLGGKGTYDRAIAGVKDYKENFNGFMGSKMTIAPENLDSMYNALIYMIKDSGYRNINLNCIYEKGWNLSHAKKLYNELHKLIDWLFDNKLENDVYLSMLTADCGKPLSPEDNQNWCGGTGLMIAVDYKGDIYPCLRYMESSIGDEISPFIIGNVKDGINIKQEHRDRINCLSCITRRSQSTDECFNCPIATGCGWCSAYNYEVYGTPNKRATYICCMHKARVLANVYYQRRKGIDYPMNCPKDWALEIIGEDEYNKLISMKVGEI